MADSRHLGKIEKSPYLGRGLSDFDEIWHNDEFLMTQFDPLDRSDHKNFKNPRRRTLPS